ncbi:hypothetical protein [Agaribacter flavus]|uniref:DNA-binding protein n=1 Tax=Agaribacter flavus TaxID=1902781 RepID=A0ABV7FRK5_9ALTE
MRTFEFTLNYHLREVSLSMDDIDDRLFESGCDDALVAHSGTGLISLDFTRRAQNAWRAVFSAMHSIERALPAASLVEVKPDYVGVSDIADYFNVSRQYVQKLIVSGKLDYPPITNVGNTSVYHLFPVLDALKATISSSISDELEELAAIAMKVNIKRVNKPITSSLVKVAMPRTV